MGFTDNRLVLATVDGVNFTLLDRLTFIRTDGTQVIVPCGTQTDGFSAPQAVTCLIPVLGKKLYAGVVHDAAYRNTLHITAGDVLVPANLSRLACDRLLLEVLLSLGVGFIQRTLIYCSLRLFGGGAFRKVRSS